MTKVWLPRAKEAQMKVTEDASMFDIIGGGDQSVPENRLAGALVKLKHISGVII